jgi:hypothetical protein
MSSLIKGIEYVAVETANPERRFSCLNEKSAQAFIDAYEIYWRHKWYIEKNGDETYHILYHDYDGLKFYITNKDIAELRRDVTLLQSKVNLLWETI